MSFGINLGIPDVEDTPSPADWTGEISRVAETYRCERYKRNPCVIKLRAAFVASEMGEEGNPFRRAVSSKPQNDKHDYEDQHHYRDEGN